MVSGMTRLLDRADLATWKSVTSNSQRTPLDTPQNHKFDHLIIFAGENMGKSMNIRGFKTFQNHELLKILSHIQLESCSSLQRRCPSQCNLPDLGPSPTASGMG